MDFSTDEQGSHHGRSPDRRLACLSSVASLVNFRQPLAHER